MKTKTLFVSVLAVLGLTACERTLDVGEDNASTGQVKNSVLQVRTRGASGDCTTRAKSTDRFDDGYGDAGGRRR